MTTIEARKQAIRREALERRDAIDTEERQRRGQAACERLFSQVAAAKGADGRHPVALALYDSMGSEVPTGRLLQLALGAGWTVCLPVLTAAESASSLKRRTMAFVAVTSENIAAARELFLGHPLRSVRLEQLVEAGITEADPASIDAFAVPLVAFDDQNRRLGYGGGYYDAVLAQVLASPENPNARTPFVRGLAFAEQQVDRVPTDAHDVPLPGIIVA